METEIFFVEESVDRKPLPRTRPGKPPTQEKLQPACAGYLLSGVWPSSATACSAFSSVLQGSNPALLRSISAPGDGRTPLNTYCATLDAGRAINGAETQTKTPRRRIWRPSDHHAG